MQGRTILHRNDKTKLERSVHEHWNDIKAANFTIALARKYCKSNRKINWQGAKVLNTFGAEKEIILKETIEITKRA